MEEEKFMQFKLKKTIPLILITILIAGSVFAQSAMVTFRFDDGLLGQYELARPVLDKYNYSAVNYIFTDPPEEGDWDGYMSWSQIEELQNTYGWEIGGHSKSHPNLKNLSDSELIEELSGSKTILQNHGINAKSFASPFGEYDNRVLSYIAKYYESHGSAWPFVGNVFPYNDYDIAVREPSNTTSVETIKNWIDQANTNKEWLVLLFHNIVESNPVPYEYSKQDFESVVDYVNSQNIPVVIPTEALVLPGENLYKEGLIDVDPTQTYILKAFFDCPNLSSGYTDIFTDEYDDQGNWLDWDWQTGVWKSFVGYRSILYTPGPNTSKLNIFIENNSSCSVDRIVLVDADGITPPPPPPLDNLYSEDLIDIDPNEQYTFKTDFDCPEFVSGGVDIFFDEYNEQGDWLNWTWATGIWNAYTGTRYFNYTPSPNTNKLFIITETVPGSNLTCTITNHSLVKN